MMKQNIKYFLIALLFSATSVYSKGIHLTNKILTCVGSKQISVLDVKKEMDRQIFMNQKTLFSNPQGLGAYYTQNWKPTLKKIVEDEVLLLEADNLKYDIPATEVTKKVAELYGNDLVQTLQFLSLTESTAKKHARREVISTHLSWFNVWSKSVMAVTPKVVYAQYEQHLKDLERNNKWTYQTIYVKGSDKNEVQDTTGDIQSLIRQGKYENLTALLDNLNFPKDSLKVKVSKDITLKSRELAPKLLNILASLDEGMISEPITGKSKDLSHTARILKLKKITKEPLPDYKDVNQNMKNTMVAKNGEGRANNYFSSLYKKYDVNGLYGNSLAKYNEPLFSME